MHVATRDILQKHFSKMDLELLGPLVHYFFKHDASGLTDTYLQSLLQAKRSNMYDKRKRLEKLLRAGVDYVYLLDQHNRKFMSFTYNAFIICVRSSYSPAMLTENRRRINLVLDFDRISGCILAAHNVHSDTAKTQARATLLRMKQKQVSSDSEIERLQRIVVNLEKQVDELNQEKRTLAHQQTNVRGVVGRTLREFLQSMGLSIDESRAKDVRTWFHRISARQQGVAYYDVKSLSGVRKDYLLIDTDKAEALRVDINKSAERLPLK